MDKGAVRKEVEINLYELGEERERQARRKTKKHKDMRKYSDWEWLMRQVPGFWR